MTADEALAIVQQRREELSIEPDLQPGTVEQAIVPVRRGTERSHAVAWIVLLTCAWGFVRVDVDAATGEILKIRRSA